MFNKNIINILVLKYHYGIHTKHIHRLTKKKNVFHFLNEYTIKLKE